MRGALLELERARGIRERALRKLASLVRPSSDGFLFDQELVHVLRRRCARIKASHGYVGHAIGLKRSDGVAIPELSVTVFVRKKLSKRQLRRVVKPAAPRRFVSPTGHTITTDVVPFKLHTKQAFPGALIGSSTNPTPGTLACFARDVNGALLGVTAGHIGYRAGPYQLPPRSGNVFGVLSRSLRSPVDAATIQIQSAYSQELPTGGTFAGWRALTKYDIGSPVQLYGAQSESWNGGVVEYLAPWIGGGWDLADTIIYSAQSVGGDSGGPLIDLQGNLVGLHVGRGMYAGHDVAIASSIVRVVSELGINMEFT
jgi:hypothetical protein